MSLGNGTRSVPPSHIEFVDVALCGWACLRESVLIGGSNVASRRGYKIEDFLQYGFGENVQMLSKRPCCATRGLLATDHVILNHGQVTWTTPELAPPSPNYHTNWRTFQLSTDLTCIAALHGGSLVVLGSNP
ncbi:hypothetical protein TNCV_3305821 [Trichonephila clavipes]|nr:hypothetical protein TNCV_3305821 [Trichonephila clavipes]